MHRSALSLVAFFVLLPGAAQGQGGPAAKDQASIYEGWRQYSVHCARCHGQDVLGNPVAANLLVSVAPGGPAAERETFLAVVAKGRPERGMPGFAETMSPEQMAAVYDYVKGRAEKRVPPGRPKEAGG
jgi:mono/diheme cytochrome c family protein